MSAPTPPHPQRWFDRGFEMLVAVCLLALACAACIASRGTDVQIS